MKNRNHVSGFTLIELLVVIAIIGILSAVVLAALNTARAKGNDGAVESNLNNARAQAEIFYSDNSNNYVVTPGGTSDVCSATGVANGVKGIYQFAAAAAKADAYPLNADISTAGSITSVTCHAAPASGSYAPLNSWAIEAPLKGSYAGFTKAAWCVQNDGFSGLVDISGGSKLAAGDAKCSQ